VIQKHVKAKKKLRDVIFKLNTKNTNLQSRVSSLKASLNEASSLNVFTKTSRVANPHRSIMSTHGTYRIAVKRNQGHAGQLALVHMLEQNINRWAVSRAEMLLSTFFNGASKIWYDEKYMQLEEVLRDPSANAPEP
jgi:hypothetical protein